MSRESAGDPWVTRRGQARLRCLLARLVGEGPGADVRPAAAPCTGPEGRPRIKAMYVSGLDRGARCAEDQAAVVASNALDRMGDGRRRDRLGCLADTPRS